MSSELIEIHKVKIKIRDVVVELTPDETRQLRDVLQNLIGPRIDVQPAVPFYPYQPIYIPAPCPGTGTPYPEVTWTCGPLGQINCATISIG